MQIRHERPRVLLACGLLAAGLCSAQAPNAKAPQGDPLGRDNPRATVTRFLETCRTHDYEKAAEYLDLDNLPNTAQQQKADLALGLESILNSASHFDIGSVSQDPDGAETSNLTTVTSNGRSYTLTVIRTAVPGGPAMWRFAPETVAVIPELAGNAQHSWLARFLPKPFVSITLLETPLWKWIALVLAAAVLISLSNVFDLVFGLVLRVFNKRSNRAWTVWGHQIIRPIRVIVLLAIFRLALEFIDPSAVARLYIGRLLQLILAWSIAWCIIKLVALFFQHLETKIDARRQVVSRSLLHMGRRTANALVIIFTGLLLLSNWGYNTTTLIAGLGVGGIAVALAAQQTIANVFGGVSIIGDHPVSIGEFGKFGDLIGTVEDIGMRSTRVRTLNRTVVSVPNSSFATINLENYSERDKILFNPTFQIKRNTPHDKIRALAEALGKALKNDKRVEADSTPVRLTALSSTSYSLEIFCYVLTDDINQFYDTQGDLLLIVSDTLEAAGVELA